MQNSEPNGQNAPGQPTSKTWLIPRPAKISRHLSPDAHVEGCLLRQMKLAKTVERIAVYCHVVARIAALSDEHATHIKHIEPRSNEWQAFLEIVKQELSIMNAYGYAWPVSTIVSQHRARIKRLPKLSGGGAGLLRWGDLAPLVPGVQHLMRHFSSHFEVFRSPRTTSRAPRATIARHGHRRQLQDAANSRQLLPQPSSTSTNASHCPSTGSGNRGSASAASRTGEPKVELEVDAHLEPLLAFLRALNPDLSALLPLLVQKGVGSQAELEGLARMARVRRKKLMNAWAAWLREEAITELEFEVLDTGLDAMAAMA